jgi:hypothetical protein
LGVFLLSCRVLVLGTTGGMGLCKVGTVG